jgi:hypothetical protein
MVEISLYNATLKENMSSIEFQSNNDELVSVHQTTISVSNLTPNFYDEVKIILPLNITNEHYLLFNFFNISHEKKKKVDHEVKTKFASCSFKVLSFLEDFDKYNDNEINLVLSKSDDSNEINIGKNNK